MNKDSLIRFISVCVFTLAVCISGRAQTQTAPPKDQEEGFRFSSIPIVQPVTETGGGLALTYRYHLDAQNKTSSSSSTGFGGFLTGNRSWGVGASQKLYFDEDLWRAQVAGSYADVHYNFYGIGTEAGNAGVSERVDQKGFGGFGELMYRFDGYWYGGAQYRFLKVDSTFRPNPQFDSSVISPAELDLRIGSLGPALTRDSRDDINYPTSGALFDLRAGFKGAAVGSQVNYQTYDFAYSRYFTLGPHKVLAVRGAACGVGGSVPFFDLCLLSASENLRGYPASRYRDRTMLASQAEFRLEAWKRVGVVGFGGLGEAAPKFSDFSFDNVLPGVGFGARYRVTREDHLNLRFDVAWGKNNHEIYFYIGEAF